MSLARYSLAGWVGSSLFKIESHLLVGHWVLIRQILIWCEMIQRSVLRREVEGQELLRDLPRKLSLIGRLLAQPA